MKIYISYRFTGEDKQVLHDTIGEIARFLKNIGHEVFFSLDWENFFQENKFSTEQIYDYCLAKQKDYDCLLAIVKSDHKSTGMELEVREAIENKQPIILIIKEGLDFAFFREQAKKVIEFTELTEVHKHLEALQL